MNTKNQKVIEPGGNLREIRATITMKGRREWICRSRQKCRRDLEGHYNCKLFNVQVQLVRDNNIHRSFETCPKLGLSTGSTSHLLKAQVPPTCNCKQLCISKLLCKGHGDGFCQLTILSVFSAAPWIVARLSVIITCDYVLSAGCSSGMSPFHSNSSSIFVSNKTGFISIYIP